MTRLMDWIKPETFYLADTVYGHHWGDTEAYQDARSHFVPLIRKLPVFDITNVAEYFYMSGDEYDDSKGFPNIIPPFSECWVEFDYPTHRMTPWGTIEPTTEKAPKKMAMVVTADHSDDGWDLRLTPVWGYSESMQAMQGWEIKATADQYGNPTSDQVLTVADQSLTDDQIQSTAEVARGFYGPIFLAFSFLHCKNVRVERSEGQYPNRQARRSAQRNGDEPLVSFHTLQIEPMKKVLATEGGIATNGLKKALHICRGHFHEYGEQYGKGKLFGKLEGRYFIPAHTRGSSEIGIADKDYNVKAPRKEAA